MAIPILGIDTSFDTKVSIPAIPDITTKHIHSLADITCTSTTERMGKDEPDLI